MVRHVVRSTRLITIVLCLVSQTSCVKSDAPPRVSRLPAAQISKAPFGNLQAGQGVSQFTLINTNGVELKVIDYGGIITSLRTPDRHGVPADIVLGHDNMTGYRNSSPYFGAIVGRYGNRIAKGHFTLDGIAHSRHKQRPQRAPRRRGRL